MPQNVAVVLAQAFAQTGTSKLPYSAQFQALVQQHLTELLQDLPSLHIKTRDYTHIDGSTVHLLLAEGTVPMYYQGVKYNIPVALWLPERYPLQAPLAYVVPTPDMVIKPRHSFVDASGLVHTPYIQQWQYPACNLREMAQDMSMHFGGDPPLFSKPKGWVEQPRPPPPPPVQQPWAQPQPPQPQPPRPSAYSPYGPSSAVDVQNPLKPQQQPPSSDVGMDSVWEKMMGASAGTAAGAAAAAAAAASMPTPPPVPQQVAQPPPPPRVVKEDPTPKLAATFRSAAAAMLNKRLHASLSAIAQQAAADGDEQLRLQATLRQRGEQLQQEVAALQAERVALDKLSHDLAASSAQLDKWLSENEHLAAAADDPSKLDPDAVISAADPLSQQALEVQAQDLALEDALYALDKSLNAGSLEPDAYLKQVRATCRRQFFVRCIGNKVAVQQQQEAGRQQRSAAAASPADVQRSLSAGRAVVLPQGDSWANAGIIASKLPPDAWYAH